MNGETPEVNGMCEENVEQQKPVSQQLSSSQKKKQKPKKDQQSAKDAQQQPQTPKSSYNRIFPALPGSSSLSSSSSSNNQNGHQNGQSNGGPHHHHQQQHHHRTRKPDMETEKQKMRIGPSNVSKLFYVSHDERKSDISDRFGEGELQSSCGQISRETGANIEFCLSKDQSLSFIVTGRDQDVQDALQKIANRFQTVPSRQISIAKEFHKTIIGLKGVKLKEIEMSTSTKIQIPRIMSQSDLITISGPKDGIEKAAIEIQRIAAEQANRASETLMIEKEFHQFICGVNNRLVLAMMNELGVKINVPPELVEKDDIIIVGNRENVSIAKNRILDALAAVKSSYVVVTWDVPKSQHKYIGSRSMFNELLENFNVVINCPPADSTSLAVQLRGPIDTIGDALKSAYRQAFSMKKVELDVENSYHKYLMGEKGVNFQNMKEQYPRTNVRLMKVEDRVEIEGPNEEVDMVEEQIRSMLKDVSFEKVPIDAKFIMRIIGRSGINLNYLKNQYNVMVNILDEDQNKKFVTIVGKKDDVASAFEDISGQIKKLENEEDIRVEIEQKHHGAIIGSKGKNVRELRDKYPEVVINFPDASENANYVHVRGPREEVLLVKEFLLEKAKEIEEASFRKEIHIRRDIYDFLAEKGTLKIRKIQADTATKIDYYDGTETLVIIGRRENVARAEEIVGSVLEESPNVANAEVHVPPKFIEIFTRLPNWALNAAIDGAAEVVVKLENERNSNVVRIKGDQELVEKVRGQLENIALYSQEFEVNTQYQQTVISSNLKRIQETMNVKTITANLKDSSKNIAIIVGPKEHLKRAVDKFDAIIKNIDKMIEDTILIDMKFHKNFLTRKSELCNRIIDECGGNLTIVFPSASSQSDLVTIQGFRESVHLAKQKLNDHVNDFMSFVEIECVIPQRHHRNIVGPKGSVVKEICSKFNVNIKLPSKSSNNYENGYENGNDYDGMANGAHNSNDTILIVGKAENCELAKQSLIDLIPVTREVEVPCDLHYSIIGQKGRNIRSLMDKFNVYVDVPSSSLKSNTIKITGSKKNIDEAISEIMQQTFEIKLQVDPKWHSKIIGRKGAVVNKIRGDHNVKIVFPNKDDLQNDTITIIGNEVDATAAKSDILKIMDEFKNMYMEEVHIDSNVHSRLIGSQGGHIKKVMKTYNVEITFPRGDETNSDIVTVYGNEQNVQEAVKYLEDKAEDFLQEFDSEMYDKSTPAATTTKTYADDMFVNASKKNNGYVNGNGRSNGNGAITWEHPTVTATAAAAAATGNGASVASVMPNTACNKDFPSFNANDMMQTQSNDGLTAAGQPTQPLASGSTTTTTTTNNNTTTSNSLPVVNNAWGLPSKRR